jgi:hypothetical protein
VIAFLPKLPRAAGLVLGFALREEIEEPGAPLVPELRGELPRGELLQVRHDPREIVRMHDGMKVVLHDYPSVDAQPFFAAAVIE